VTAVRGKAAEGLRRRDNHRAIDRFPVTWTGGFDPDQASGSVLQSRHSDCSANRTYLEIEGE
jgi:hypothetical protein